MQGIGLRQRDAFPKGAFKAFPELGGGAAGKGNGKDALSGDAVLEETLDAAHKGAGFAGTRAGDDRHRPLAGVRGLTLLGGDPFEPENQRALVPFLHRVRERYPDKDIWAFSGFELDKELTVDGAHPRCEVTDEMLSLIDILVDGRYVDAQRNLSLRFRGSENQRIIDMNRTRAAGHIVLWEGMNGWK